jgi:hypothetical protein
MNNRAKGQQGLMMIEVLIAMTLLVTAASGTLWFLHRALRGAALQRAQLAPLCDYPECSSEQNVSECRCGAQTFLTMR